MHLRSVAEGTLFVLGVLVIGLDDTIAEPGADVAGRGEVVLHCVGKFLKLGREFELCNRGGPLATSLSCAALVPPCTSDTAPTGESSSAKTRSKPVIAFSFRDRVGRRPYWTKHFDHFHQVPSRRNRICRVAMFFTTSFPTNG